MTVCIRTSDLVFICDSFSLNPVSSCRMFLATWYQTWDAQNFIDPQPVDTVAEPDPRTGCETPLAVETDCPE
jgi:hypothetical protein